MKIAKYISAMSLFLALFASCESDLDKAIYDSETAQPARLQALNESYTLDKTKADAEAIKFQWAKPELGFQSAAKSSLEMDVDGHDFANKTVLASTSTDSTYSITNAELNSKVLGLLETYKLDADTPVKLAFRISTTLSDAVAPLVSNVVTATITPYSGEVEYPKVWVIGSYCDWNFANSQFLFSFDNSTTYQAVVDFGEKAAEGFKITGQDAWVDATNWGTDGKTTPKDEAASITLWADGGSGNIQCYSKRFYHFTFNTKTAVLTKDYGFNVLGIVGDGANGWGDNDDIVLNFDKAKQRFWADVTLKDGAIKFRADHGWDLNYGGADGLLKAGGDNINVTAGNYRVYVNLNNPAKLTYELSAKDYGK